MVHPLMSIRTFEFAKRAAIAIVLALLPLLVWYLRDFLLIVVGALLFATLLMLVSEPLTRWGRLPRGLSLALSGLLILAAIGGSAYFFGTRIGFELQDVSDRADEAMRTVSESLHNSQFGRALLSHTSLGNFSLPTIASNIVTVSARVIAGIAFSVAAGAYLAAQPGLYTQGFVYLFPKRFRGIVKEIVGDAGRALRLWLLGQAISMCLIAVFSTLAVWAIGLPSPLALGAIAGVAEFVPYVGPIIAAIPAVLVAVTNGPYSVLWTLAAYAVIHQVEGNVIAPLVQRRMVFIPPAVLLLSIAAISVTFGVASIVFAAPITVLAFVAVRRLYAAEALDQIESLPAEPSRCGGTCRAQVN
jgi:predicted PurR-regulated permease PerM